MTDSPLPETAPTGEPESCTSASCRCHDVSRRQFLAVTGGAAAVVLGAGLPRAIASGPGDSLRSIVPLDKNLDPAWVRSLYERGEPMRCTAAADELNFIGMPVGGLCAGQVYLGGDGRLWLFDIFNRPHEGVVERIIDDYEGQRLTARHGSNYVEPPAQFSPLDQGFAVRVHDDGVVRPLDRRGFDDITFTGTYPIGRVAYRDASLPIEVDLEAFSPFIPLNTADSSLPATVMRFRIRNRSDRPTKVDLLAWLQNPVLMHEVTTPGFERRNRIVQWSEGTALVCSPWPVQQPKSDAPDILFADFESGDYDGWTSRGDAFGLRPFRRDEMAPYHNLTAHEGEATANSHNTRIAGADHVKGDALTGTLTSPSFTIERDYVNFLVSGGSHQGATCINLLVDGEVVRSVSGDNSNRMKPRSFDVRDLRGREAVIELVDAKTGPWGHIGVDHIVFADAPATSKAAPTLGDYGQMTLMMTGHRAGDVADAGSSVPRAADEQQDSQSAALTSELTGSLARTIELRPGEAATITCVLSWYFPNVELPALGAQRRWYAGQFDSAAHVARYVATELHRLRRETRRWTETWYDSTLPCWFLDRTFANTSTLATNTCYRLENGRFWAWEGIGCCAGTCTHVWHYAQAVGRLFPDLERDLRRRTDYGIAFDEPTGRIRFRAENNNRDAADGQAGVILRTCREHQMSADDSFLRGIWPQTMRAIEYLIAMDAEGGPIDGMIEGEQHNTLDAAWYGRIPAIASLYLAALAAGATMADDMDDPAFADRCREIGRRGAVEMDALFANDYFVQIEDEQHLDAIGIGSGCHIDQVMGQGWAFQLGLGRLFDASKTKSALQSLWDYNFIPDVGPLRASLAPNVRGRPYAIQGDAGLLMCTWPRGGRRSDWERHWQYGYFNECMSGFEYQAASHMIYEGTPGSDLVEHGLAITRAIHDRYHAGLRNPYNEVECSDHYARAMASYGVYLAVCGFSCHGPRGYIGFAPRLSPDDFKAAFTTAESWGSYTQQRADGRQVSTIEIRHGQLELQSVGLGPDLSSAVRRVQVEVNGQEVSATWRAIETDVLVHPDQTVSLHEGDVFTITVQLASR
jgi:non-lysosomal glucosylceramidase